MHHEKALEKLIKAEKDNSVQKGAFSGFAGVWKNQIDSIADISISGSNVSGTYTSMVSSEDKKISGPISGYFVDDIIGFSVLWPTKSGSITTWVGQVVDVNGVENLKTLWHLVVNIPDEAEDNGLWTTIHTGADDFIRSAES